MTKKALSVGINNYADPRNNLRGCVNDSIMIREMLKKHYNFKHENITLLLDDKATQMNIIDKLKELVSGAEVGDIIVFHFSGHGSQVLDINNDENDGLDEIICPYDMDWNNPLTDDIINNIIKIKKGVNFTMILDCCHSGSGNRDFIRPGVVPIESKFLSPPTALIPNSAELERLKIRTFHTPKDNYAILLSGCQDNQTSMDAWIDGDYHGAFTFYLNECLRNNKWKIKLGELREQIIKALRFHNYVQRPVLSGPTGVENTIFLDSYNNISE